MGLNWMIGQNMNNDTIWWKGQSNTYTLLSELNTVTIKLINGTQIKEVSIRNIDTSSEKIEYLGRGVLHDVYISEIRMIIPGKHYYQVLEFDNSKRPYLRINGQIDPLKDYSHFPKHTLPQKTQLVSTSLTPKIDSSYSMPIKPGYAGIACDTLILSNKKILLIHVQSIEGRYLKYKRADVPDGPIYNVALGTAIIKQYKFNYTIDYSIYK